MIFYLLVLVQQAAAAQVASGRTEVWPITITGWFTLAAVIFGVLSYAWGWMKFFSKLNGFGGRLAKVERRQEAADAQANEQQRLNDRITRAQEALLERIVKAEQGAEKCSTDMRDYAVDIGSKVDMLIKEIHAEGRTTGERLKAIETELTLGRRRSRRSDQGGDEE
jgi:hypothetical protein